MRGNLALLAVAGLLLAAPLAAAGSQADPDYTDTVDDVRVADGVNCPLPRDLPVPLTPDGCVWGTSNDFHFNNIDIELTWANVTADGFGLNLTIQMKAGSAFHAGGEFFGQLPPEQEPFTYVYDFAFTLNGTEYHTGAAMDSAGTMVLNGVGASFVVWDDHILSIFVPWDAVGDPANGTVLSGLTFTAHGDGDVTLDDVAPNEGGAARDFTITRNQTAAPANAPGNATAGTPGGSFGGTATSRGPFSGTNTGTASRSATGTSAADGEAESDGDGKDAPNVPFAVASLALLGLVALARRRL